MIAHVDGDAFFASVLERQQPNLKSKPLLVLGMGGSCIIAANYLAKRAGVKTAMRFSEAKLLVKDFNALPADFLQTGIASAHIEELLRETCSDVESSSIDEWFLDLCGVPGGIPRDLANWAVMLQQKFAREVGLAVSIGVAPSKILAKMASDYRKPKGITVIKNIPGEHPLDISIESFLKDRPVAAIPGIGSRRQVHARSQEWATAWDYALADEETVVHLFGRPGKELQQELRGEAIYKVVTEEAAQKSISRCRTFKATYDRKLMSAYMMEHLTYTILKMRRQGLACRFVAVWLRTPDYKHIGADMKLPDSMTSEERILPYAERCFRKLYDPKMKFNQIGVLLGNLGPVGPTQFSLFENTQRTEQAESLQKSLDQIRDRFGRDSIRRGYSSLLSAKKKELPILEY